MEVACMSSLDMFQGVLVELRVDRYVCIIVKTPAKLKISYHVSKKFEMYILNDVFARENQIIHT
jgi:hypothetical protein